MAVYGAVQDAEQQDRINAMNRATTNGSIYQPGTGQSPSQVEQNVSDALKKLDESK